jgi:plasmid stabilization system protein ParE
LSSGKKAHPATVVLTERALADLREVERYSMKEWGRRVAGKYINDIESALDRLRESPGLLRREPDLAPGLFFYRVRKHVLVCDVEGQAVTVLTVIHTAMDIPSRLAELEPRLILEARFLHEKLRRQSKPD